MAEVLRRLAVARIKVAEGSDHRPARVAIACASNRQSIESGPEDRAGPRPPAQRCEDGVHRSCCCAAAASSSLDRQVDPDELQRGVADLRTSAGVPQAGRQGVARVERSAAGAFACWAAPPTGGRADRRRFLSAADMPSCCTGRRPRRSATSPGPPPTWPLLDEANALTAGVGRRYGHVVVDEAQDLSAMALRAAGRRATGGFDDRARRHRPGHRHRCPVVVGGDRGGPRRRPDVGCGEAELTVGYRVPGPILDYANQLLPGDGPVDHPVVVDPGPGRRTTAAWSPTTCRAGVAEADGQPLRRVGERSA